MAEDKRLQILEADEKALGAYQRAEMGLISPFTLKIETFLLKKKNYGFFVKLSMNIFLLVG